MIGVQVAALVVRFPCVGIGHGEVGFIRLRHGLRFGRALVLGVIKNAAVLDERDGTIFRVLFAVGDQLAEIVVGAARPVQRIAGIDRGMGGWTLFGFRRLLIGDRAAGRVILRIRII